MKERPIIFSADSIRAIRDIRKTQTRRVIKPQPEEGYVIAEINEAPGFWLGRPVLDGMIPIKQIKCPYEIGMHLWVKEAWRALDDYNGVGNTSTAAEIEYRADNAHLWCNIPEDRQEEMFFKLTPWVNDCNTPWCSPMFMYRFFSRYTLELLDVRVDLVENISNEDAIAEGLEIVGYTDADQPKYALPGDRWTASSVNAFAYLWDTINKKRGYSFGTNTWVWALTFRLLPESVLS